MSNDKEQKSMKDESLEGGFVGSWFPGWESFKKIFSPGGVEVSENARQGASREIPDNMLGQYTTFSYKSSTTLTPQQAAAQSEAETDHWINSHLGEAEREAKAQYLLEVIRAHLKAQKHAIAMRDGRASEREGQIIDKLFARLAALETTKNSQNSQNSQK